MVDFWDFLFFEMMILRQSFLSCIEDCFELVVGILVALHPSPHILCDLFMFRSFPSAFDICYFLVCSKSHFVLKHSRGNVVFFE